MKIIDWQDEKGRTFRSVIPDDTPDDMAQYGVPVGPPDLDRLDWESIKSEINGVLVRNGLYTWDHVQGDPHGVGVALSIFKRYLIALYRDEWQRPKP